VQSSADYLADHMAEVPVLVIGAIEAPGGELSAGNQAGLWGSLLPAAWSLQLALRARGLGSAWTTLHLAYEKEIAELLGIPPEVRQGVLLPVAHYTGETFKPAPRQPLDEVLHVDGW
jgi:nitroreductase